MSRALLVIFFLLAALPGRGQRLLRLEDCYQLALGLLAIMLLWTWLLAASPEFGRVSGVAQELGLTLDYQAEAAE